MIKVDGRRRLTLRNRRFICEIDLRKTSLEDHQPLARTLYNPIAEARTREDEALCFDTSFIEPAITRDARTITAHATVCLVKISQHARGGRGRGDNLIQSRLGLIFQGNSTCFVF